ncbi:phosphocholine-specific phospholipase C [Amycolatopsis sp. NPDC051372]|uniref:phosphocholine-specific phospholipase C n=1 Tax=Amycolatopsis sp. NPDC051372 TaxID=3155669 RepID=UPI0034145AD1
MSDLSRRGFLGAAAAVTGAAVVGAGGLAANEAKASPRPAVPSKRYGDLRDIKHVVILMQENRSFDHYFGSLKGVRGFGDRSAITLPGGNSVFQQPTTAPTTPAGGTQFPWKLSDAKVSQYPASHQPPTSEVGAQGYGGTSHSWDDQHGAWYGGLMNGWYYAKGGPTTLGYLDRSDIPWHYALADTYTVGDAYHCSVLSATGPNRTYLWSGSINAAKKHGDYVAFNGGDELGKHLLWESYAETLQKTGYSWKVYQGSDNYGDNGVEYFDTFAKLDPSQGGTAAPGNVFYDNGVAIVPEPHTGLSANADNLTDALRADVVAGKLAKVSWMVTNQAFSEHPDGSPNDGAYYVNNVLEALNADPEVFNSTLVIIDYDENDGQFDHVPPPVPAPGADEDEFYLEATGALASAGLTKPMPVGLGFRVPLLLISPWTRGGWVTSEVSDHTSVIQFLEKWTEALGKTAHCPNISAWRRSVCGDLTGSFDFHSPVYGLPRLPKTTVIGDPAGGSYQPPVTTNKMPKQEAGTKKARALPYQPNANLDGFSGANGVTQAKLSFSNNGKHVRKASHFAVYDNTQATPSLKDYPAKFPGQYTVAPSSTIWDKTVPGSVQLAGNRYDITVVGPNRFLRQFTGDLDAAGQTAQVTAAYFDGILGFGSRPRLLLELENNGSRPVTFTVKHNQYSDDRPKTYRVSAHGRTLHSVDPCGSDHGWYDVTVTLDGDKSWSRRYVGHLEDGSDSITG